MSRHNTRNKKVKKVERLPNESKGDCISRAIPILIGEGMSQDQATAAAESMCDLRKFYEDESSAEEDVDKNFWNGIFK